MEFLKDLFTKPYPSAQRDEVERLLTDLIRIGQTEDYLSERPGGAFNAQCHNIHAREIGKQLDAIGGLPLMEYANRQVQRKLGESLSSHLEYAWKDIGKWIA